MPSDHLSLGAARRLALAAQGFQRPRPRGRVDIRHVRHALHRMSLLQLDYVNVVVPSHYLVLFSRLGPFDRGKLDQLTYQRREFIEHWAHEASIVPAATWPLLRYRREAHRVRPWGFEKFLDANPRYVQRMVKRYAAKAGIDKNISPHTLRHSFATDLYRETSKIRLVQKVLGHSDLSTTMIYTHIFDEEVESALKSFRQTAAVAV